MIRILLAMLALLCLASSPAPPGCALPGGDCTRSHYAEPCPRVAGSKERRCVIYIPALITNLAPEWPPTDDYPDPGIE